MDTVKHRGGRRPSAISADPKVGERLKHFRTQQGLSQAELAEGICATTVVSHLETGRAGTTVETLAKFADKLKVPLHEIFREPQGDYPYSTKLELVEAYILRGEFEPAQDFLDHLAAQEDLVIVEHHKWVLLQGTLYNKSSRPLAAIEVLQPLIEQVEQLQNADDELTCKLYTQLGNSYYHLRDFTRAYATYKRAYQVSLRLCDFELTSAIAAYNLGMICNEIGIGDEGVVYLDQAREYYESVADLRKLADAYFYTAVASQNEDYVTKALTLYQSLDAIKLVNLVRQYHAIHFQAPRDYKDAASTLHDVAMEMDRLFEVGNSLFSLANSSLICLDHGDLKEGTKYLELAKEYKTKGNITEPYDLAIYHKAHAKMFLATGEYESCVEEAKKSSEMYDQMGKNVDSADCLELVIEAYRRQGMHESACEVYKIVTAKLCLPTGGRQR